MSEPHVEVIRRGPVAFVTLKRATKRNALAKRTVREITAALEEASFDQKVRGVVLAAEGDVFMAGGDLGEFETILDDPRGAAHVIEMGRALACIEACDVPVIAAVSGDVFGGGCEVVLLCDVVLAERHAGLSFRHVPMGLTTAWGGAARLLERVGPLHATRLVLTGDRIGAEEAERIGLVTRVVDAGRGAAEAELFVERVARHDRAVVAANKRALRDARARRREGLAEIEGAAFSALWGGPAHRAAMSRRPGSKRS